MAVGREHVIRFCNNPSCDLCDVIARPHEILNRAGEEICRQCFEPLTANRVRPRLPLLPAAPHRTHFNSFSSKEA